MIRRLMNVARGGTNPLSSDANGNASISGFQVSQRFSDADARIALCKLHHKNTVVNFTWKRKLTEKGKAHWNPEKFENPR